MKRIIFFILFVLSSIYIYAQKDTSKATGSLFGVGYYYNGNNNYTASLGFWVRGGHGRIQGQFNFEYTNANNKNFYSLAVQGAEGPAVIPNDYFFLSQSYTLQTDFTSFALKLRPIVGVMYKGYVKVGYSYSINIPHAFDGSSHHAIHAYIYLFRKNKR